MVQFLTAKAILDGLKLFGLFVLLGGLPLLLIMLIKKIRWQHPLIRQLNGCIRHGTSFGEKDCQQVELCLQGVKNRFALLKGESLSPLQKAAPLNIAFQSLPLLEQMAKANTCCAIHVAHLPPFNHTFACKQRLEELLSQWAQDEQLPLVGKEIQKIKKISKKIEQKKTNYRLKLLVIMLAFSISSFLVADLIISETPAWETKIIAYLGFLFLFAFSYDYYYSQKFKRFQGNRLTRWFKR